MDDDQKENGQEKRRKTSSFFSPAGGKRKRSELCEIWEERGKVCEEKRMRSDGLKTMLLPVNIPVNGLPQPGGKKLK